MLNGARGHEDTRREGVTGWRHSTATAFVAEGEQEVEDPGSLHPGLSHLRGQVGGGGLS